MSYITYGETMMNLQTNEPAVGRLARCASSHRDQLGADGRPTMGLALPVNRRKGGTNDENVDH